MNKNRVRERTATRAVLKKELAAHNRKLNRLHDPVLGAVGQVFRKAAASTKCREDIDFSIPLSTNGRHYSYAYKRNKAYIENEIHYSRAFLKKPETLADTRCHEFIHALQMHCAAALSAIPFNTTCPVAICPRDYIMLDGRMEQDAYVKEQWLSDLDPTTENRRAFSAEKFNALCQSPKTRSIRDFMAVMASGLLTMKGRWDPRSPVETVTNSYARDTLRQYRDGYEWRRKYFPDEKLIFVRAEPRDILDIGNSFGPNFFGVGRLRRDFTRHEPLSAENRRVLDKLNKSMGIRNESDLPSFSEALKALGLTRKQFLQKALTLKKATPGFRKA
jgi:hypothetical protein